MVVAMLNLISKNVVKDAVLKHVLNQVRVTKILRLSLFISFWFNLGMRKEWILSDKE